MCYSKRIDIEKDKHKVFEYYQKSAKMNSSNRINYCNKGSEIEKNEHKVFEYYQKLAE